MRASLIVLLAAALEKSVIALSKSQGEATWSALCIQGCCDLPHGVKVSLPGTALECCPCEPESSSLPRPSSDSTSSNQDMFRSPGDQEDQALLLPPKPKENVGNERCTGPWCEFPGSFLDMSRHAIPDGPHVSTQSRMNEKAEMPVLSSGHSGLAWAKFCPDPPPPWCSLLQSMLNSTLTDSSDDHHDLLQGRVEADSQVVQFCGNPPPPWCEGLFSIANSTLHSFSKDQNDAVRERAKGDQQSPPILAEEKESPGIVLTRQFCEGPSPPPWCEFVSALLNDDKPDPSNNQQVLEQGHSHLHASDEGTAKESTNSSKGSDPPAWYTVPLAIRISPSDGSSQICGAWGCKPSDEMMKHLSATLKPVM